MSIRLRRIVGAVVFTEAGIVAAAVVCAGSYGWLYLLRGVRLPGPTLQALFLQQPRSHTAVSAVLCIGVWTGCALLFEWFVTRIEQKVGRVRVPLFALYVVFNLAVVTASFATVSGSSILEGLDTACKQLSPYLFGVVAIAVAAPAPSRRFRRSRARDLAHAH